jgi:hypothetical protein
MAQWCFEAVDLATRLRVAPTDDLESALRQRVRGEVRFDRASLAAYSTDSSNYRQVPIGLVVPRDVDDAVAAVAVCADHDVPVLSRITELLRVAAVAAAHGLQVSGHCAPHLHAAPLAAVPNLRHLEWFHDHVRIESMLFSGAADPQGGAIPLRDAPGHGLTWLPDAAEQFRVA